MQLSGVQISFRRLPKVFWDARGILFIYYLEKGRTINSEYFMALLVRLKEEIVEKPPQINLHFELLLHPPYFL